MRLLVITNLFTPDRGGGASVFSDLCFGLKERGWKVVVFTTHPYYPEWQRKSDASPWKIQTETLNGVELHRHGIYVPANPSRLIPRVLYELSFLISLMRSLGRGGRFDAVMVFCPLLGAVAFSAIRHFIRRDPLWLNVQDIPADAAAASGISRSPLFNRLAQWAQRLLFRTADVASTISPVMVDRLKVLLTPGHVVHLCPNWLNGSLADHVRAAPSKLGRPPGQPLRILYAGNIGKKQGLLETLKLLAATSLPFHCQVHGDGGEAGSIREWITGSGSTRFTFGEFLDESGFVKALHDCDVFLISEKAGSGASFIPSKLIPCIATGTPILAVCDREGPLGREVTENDIGLVIPWGETSDLAARLSWFASEPDKFKGWQHRCLDRAQVYDRAYSIPRMDTLIRQFAESARGRHSL